MIGSKPTVDIIFLSLGSTPELREMQQNAIDTARKGDPDVDFSILVIESDTSLWEQKYQYAGAVTLFAPATETFNYNKYMNIGRRHLNGKYVALCNNDLVFTDGWATNLMKALEEGGFDSVAPMCPTTHSSVVFNEGYLEGYEVNTVGRPLCGWCLFHRRTLYDTIGDLCEGVEFWYSDNAYSIQLQKHGLKHALVQSSKVHHLGSRTLNLHDAAQQQYLTYDQLRKFNSMRDI